MICEVCIDSMQGAHEALQGGADRLELCGDLTTGGLTPSYGLLQAVIEIAKVPVMVMIRPRAGDFCYESHEVDIMCRDIVEARNAGASGVVFGALRPDGSLDSVAIEKLLKCAAGLPVTFHRAFDVCRDPRIACDQLVTWRIARVLTSGQQPTADQGISLLRDLQTRYGDQLILLAGGGVRADNVARIIRETGVREVHFSGSEILPSRMQFQRPDVSMAAGSAGDAAPARPQTRAARVAAICSAARQTA